MEDLIGIAIFIIVILANIFGSKKKKTTKTSEKSYKSEETTYYGNNGQPVGKTEKLFDVIKRKMKEFEEQAKQQQQKKEVEPTPKHAYTGPDFEIKEETYETREVSKEDASLGVNQFDQGIMESGTSIEDVDIPTDIEVEKVGKKSKSNEFIQDIRKTLKSNKDIKKAVVLSEILNRKTY